MMFVVRRLQELARKKDIPLFICFIDSIKAYDSVDRTLLWTVWARFCVSPRTFAVIHQSHDGVRAYVRSDDGGCPDMFGVEQGPRQRCVLTPLLLNIFTAVLRVAEKRVTADAVIMDSMVQLQRKEKGEEKRGKARVSKANGRGKG